jgi:autophagy-related protein 13
MPIASSSPSATRSQSPPLTSTTVHAFPSIPHAAGTLSLRTTYLTHPNFALDDLESLLSDRFLAEGPEFTPTLNKNLQRESLQAFPRASGAIRRSTSISRTTSGSGGGTPGSLPTRTGLPASPPSATSIADRFVLPSQTHTRTTSFSGTASPRQHGPGSGPIAGGPGNNAPLPGHGLGSSPGAVSVVSHASSGGSGSREGIAARMRRESTGTGRGVSFLSRL